MRQNAFIMFALGLIIWSGAADAAALRAAYQFAEPAFERDEALCGTGAGEGLVGYIGAERVCADLLIGRLRQDARALDGDMSDVILLTSRPLERTLYRAGDDRLPILPLGNLIRRTDKPLRISGQLDSSRQPLVWFKGHDLIDTICDPERVIDVDACRKGQTDTREDRETQSWERRYEMTSLALVEESDISRALRTLDDTNSLVTDQGPRAYCIRLRHVAGIEFANLGFEDCWISGILAVNSREVSLRNSRVHGSTFGLLALATSGMEAAVHSFRITDNHWIQSPAAYRPDPETCADPHLDLSCALDPWDDLPWGITHHHIWRPLNGAFFGAFNIAGNVLFSGNMLERAYNGIRMISEVEGTGRNVEIRGNHFRMLRDNAVEPEKRADGWIVKHNIFENIHAWISTDGVEGGTMDVFGNLGWSNPDQMAGERCREDVDWRISPRFNGLAGDEGHYLLIDTAYDPTSVVCRGHYRGAVLKTGDKRKAGFPYFERISIFNNSWRTRSPLFSSKHASPLVHFNNAVSFTGCGLDGPWYCRQIPAPVQYCQPGNKRTRGRVGLEQLWTDDGQALVADCFSFIPGPAVPDDRAATMREVEHLFCRDLFDRSFNAGHYSEGACAAIVEAQVFNSNNVADLTVLKPTSGCTPVASQGTIKPNCLQEGPMVGAIQPDGRLFDIEIEGAGFLGAAFRP